MPLIPFGFPWWEEGRLKFGKRLLPFGDWLLLLGARFLRSRLCAPNLGNASYFLGIGSCDLGIGSYVRGKMGRNRGMGSFVLGIAA
jgi:hypothetical protein